jgi:hypothetical protein
VEKKGTRPRNQGKGQKSRENKAERVNRDEAEGKGKGKGVDFEKRKSSVESVTSYAQLSEDHLGRETNYCSTEMINGGRDVLGPRKTTRLKRIQG